MNGHVLSETEKKQRVAFIAKVRHEGYEQAIEEVAYTWFNRFCALRYMEVNGYLPSHVRVFTNDAGAFKPQIIDEAIHLELDGLDMDKVFALKEDASRTEELFRYLLITQCNALSSILPGMFQKIKDYTELLLPDNLLREGSVIERLIEEIPEEDWTDQIQIIGWLYQYYNAEKKDEVFAALKKNVKITKDNIPAATQLFTPDWIVRYMVENSLGRLWVEGHPNEELKAGWKYYLNEAEQEPEVEMQLKEIRKGYSTLKPEEILCIDPCVGSGHIACYLFDVLMQIYESYGYTTREAVSSIVENNLYGLDIDDRAAQLAYFAVMMKARSYDRRFFSHGVQPHVYAIRESNELEKELVEYFVGDDPKLKEDFGTLLEEMYDAKEYGSILDISQVDFSALYGRVEKLKQDVSLYALAIEEQILPLIQTAETLAQKYHVVVTNPPYMGNSGMSKKLSDFVKKNYSDSKSDMFAVFIEHCGQMTERNGYQAMITQPSLLSLTSFEKLRKKIFNKNSITSLLDMGRGIFGIDFGSTSFVLKNTTINNYKGIYFNLKKRIFQYLEPMDISVLFLEAKDNHCFKFDFDTYDTDKGIKLDFERENGQKIYYIAKQDNFSKIPGSPVAYWVSKRILNCFIDSVPLDSSYFFREGIHTANNDKFLRLWHEISHNLMVHNANNYEDIDKKGRWVPYNKGGAFRKWYGNNEYVIGFDQKYRIEMGKYKGHVRPSQSLYFKEGGTWTAVSSGKFGMRYYPQGFLFDAGGQVAIGKSIYACIAYLNSSLFEYMSKIAMPTINFKCGVIKTLPDLTIEDISVIKRCKNNIEISKSDWDSFETSWDFICHPFICPVSTIAEAYIAWENECNTRFIKLKSNEEELNRIFIDKYGLQDELTPEVEDKDVTVRKADLKRDIKSLISYAVGCMFGRYSLDEDGLIYAGGEWDPSKYQTYQPDYNGILPICDDEYFTDDIVGHFIDFIRTVYGEDTLEENLQFIADALGGNGSSREVIRKYFLNDFYKDHCKIYQKRPIYWLFDSGRKNGFKCLIYLHRYRPDTIARIRTDYVHEQQARYRTAMADLQNRIVNASTSERVKLSKRLKKMTEQADELHDYEEKIHHLADQFIDIDLDDGVKVNYAKFQDVLAKIK